MNMTLAEKINSYSDDFWDFANYRNSNAFVHYPAVMVAPMQACLLKEIITLDSSVREILDPFCGSGTALVEGRNLNLNVKGFDINPLAVLLTRVQLEGVSESKIVRSIDLLFSQISLLIGNVKPYSFKNINKWFNQDVIVSLSVIRESIRLEKDDRIRRFFWCCFAETVRKFCNSRTSTFKLHVKPIEQIEKTVDSSISFFKNHVLNSYRKLIYEPSNEISVLSGDSKKLLDCIPDESIDLIYTSPPYGDNQSTVTYGQYSILPLLWIDDEDLMIWDKKIFDNFSVIDSSSLGGRINFSEKTEEKYSPFVGQISKKKQKKVFSFLEDYEIVFNLMSKKIKRDKLLVLTLGNRRVDNIQIPFDRINDTLAEENGLMLDSTITRNIFCKRIPAKVSNINNIGSVKSMTKEYIKIYRKL